MQFHHERCEVVASGLGDRHQGSYALGTVHNVGIGKHEECGIEPASLFDSLLHGPQLSRPSRRKRLALNEVERCRAASLAYNFLSCLASNVDGGVSAAIINQQNVKRAVAGLFQ